MSLKKMTIAELEALPKEEREKILGKNEPNMRRLHMMEGCHPWMVTLRALVISAPRGIHS